MGRPILRQEDRVSFLKTLFESGQSLDLLDISGQDRSVLAPELQSFYADADTAFQSIDAERLYDKAKSLGIPNKYPSFYEYLENLQKELEEDIASAHEERTLTVEQPEEDELETQEQPQEEAEDLSMRDVVTKNLVEGEHTGKKRDSEVYRKGDEFREQLNAERRQANEEARKRYQADSYESSGQKQAEPQAPAYSRAEEPVTKRQEVYQRADTPRRDADQNAREAETRRAEAFRVEEQPGYAADTRRAEESRSAGSTDAGYTDPSRNTTARYEGINRMDAPRENAAPQPGVYGQERPAAAEDTNRSDSRRYQADSYESSGQRQAEPQASAYNRADEPVGGQKETYPRADAPRRDADQNAKEAETRRTKAFRMEEQPGYAADVRRAEEPRSVGSTNAGYTDPSRNNTARYEGINRMDAPREDAAPQSGIYEQERPAAAEDTNRNDSRRYQADSYESSGQRQAEPQASVYSRAEEPVSEQKETYQQADAPHRDADRTAGRAETNRAEASRMETQPGRTPVTPGYAAGVRHEETNRTDAPRENAAPQSGAYEQERPATAEDANRSDSRRYQADSYESSGQRQAELQAPAYNRADEPVDEQKKTYPRADAPHRDADRTAGSTETNRAEASRMETQPGRTPVTPGYAADTRRAEEPRSAGSTDAGYTNPSRNNATRHEETNRTDAPRKNVAPQSGTYEQERPTVAEDANRSDSRRYQADSYESSGQRQAAEAYAKNAQEQASNAFQTRAPKGEPSNNRVEAPQAVPGSQNAKDHIGHATKQGTGTGIAATVIAATSATSAAATEIEATVRAVQNATGNPSITNRQIADSYARTGQMDAVTAAMAAKQSASSYHRTEQQAYVNTARQTFGYVGKSPKLEGQKPDGAQTVDIGVYGVRNGNIISIKTDGASNAAKKYTIRSDGTIQINGTVANVYDTGNEKVFVGWRGATVQQDSVIVPNGQRYKLGADKTVVSATGTIFKTVKDVEATARQGQGIAVSMASIFHETGAKAADFSDSGAGFSTKDFAKVITPKSTQALMKKGVFGKAILKQQRMFSVVLQTEVMAHAT